MNKFLFSKLLPLLFAVLVSSCDNAYIKSWYKDELTNAGSPDAEVPGVKIPYVEVGKDTCQPVSKVIVVSIYSVVCFIMRFNMLYVAV